MSLEKSTNNSNLRHSKNIDFIYIINQANKTKNFLNKKEDNENNTYFF